jgi:MFS family permease
VREEGYERRAHSTPSPDRTTLPPDSPFLERRLAADRASESTAVGDAAGAGDGTGGRPVGSTRTIRLLNRGLLAALVINFGGYYSGGTYEVIWSLFLEGLGADLPLIGLTFAMFGLPILVLSPFAGRLVDKRGSLAFIVIGSILPAVTGIAYTFLSDPVFAVPLILVEATGFAFLNPALYAVVAASSPPGRSSTTQGLFGAAGTLGFIAASLAAGVLAERSILYPFYVFSAIITVSLVVGLAIGGQRLTSRSPTRGAAVSPV